MPERLRAAMLDMAVLHGIRGAVRVLQQAIVGSGYNIKVDGIIGEKTLSAAPYCDPERLRAYRVLKLSRIIVRNPSQKRFWFGWYRRAMST